MTERKQQYRVTWTVSELAKAASVSTQYIRQLISEGKIDARKADTIWLINDSEAKRFLSSRE